MSKSLTFPYNTKIEISGIKSTYLILFLLYLAFQNSDQTTMNENRIKLEMEHKLGNKYILFSIYKTFNPSFQGKICETGSLNPFLIKGSFIIALLWL